ncbi:hypothetical protein GTY87_33930 [Streptomyces sp. SID7813]|uniref:Uncharacterized protein n=2 Tax=Streptomyces TaxID=1883 RepID=O86688_STRCO|nr:hypothetical protein [Streptomyces sp. SID7813]QFI46434.1 hypothetical protein FQ762_34270 [Streptomyces coelicolor A3(2)]CAA20553.1 hypothetical protein SC4G2.16c [Streptomyces coelicolor A3(2)]
MASAQSGQQRFVRRRLQVDEDEDLSLIVRMQTGQFPAHPPTQISPSHRCSGACGILEEDAHAVGKRFQGFRIQPGYCASSDGDAFGGPVCRLIRPGG